ncbi:MAG: NAD(P)H-dependent oxidoreductase [Clostridiaceae bacterium]|jgi:flavodoxin|nr:NAD(P)H-dependent oxidoreductase [Clostridiaceae bacterium]
MSTLIIYYSYSGNTRKIAEALAVEKAADLTAINDEKRPGKFKAYSSGCLKALNGQGWAIQPLTVDLGAYDEIILLTPIWAGNVPPAVNSALELLPAGKEVSIKAVSGSGSSKCVDKLRAVVEGKGSTLAAFEDIKS